MASPRRALKRTASRLVSAIRAMAGVHNKLGAKGGQQGAEKQPSPAKSDPYFDPAIYRRTIQQLHAQLSQLDEQYKMIQSRYEDPGYQLDNLRHLGTMPTYVVADYQYSLYVWRINSLVDHITGSKSPYDPKNERVNPQLRERFERAGLSPVLEHENPAALFASGEIVITDRHLNALANLIAGRAAKSEEPGWEAFFRAKALAHVLDLLRDPAVALMRDHVQAGAQVLCYGNTLPLFECLCLELAAVPTTLTPLNIRYASDRVRSLKPAEIGAQGLKFDVAIASLSIGRAGLGTQNEEIDENGDRAVLDFLRASVLPSGKLIATFFFGPSAVLYGAGRVYDEAGLARLLRGWRVVNRRMLTPMFTLLLPDKDLIPGYRANLCSFVLSPQ